MKYASSIRYGGQLIDASDVDYQAYKHLGLLCPNCKEPIFLQGMSQRSHPTKLVEVPAHFKHFAAKDPALAKECEARVAKYDQKELEQRAASARGQQLKLLQRCFWRCIESNIYAPEYLPEIYDNAESVNILEGRVANNTSNTLNFGLWLESGQQNKTMIKHLINKVIDGISTGNIHIEGFGDTKAEINIWFRKLKGSLIENKMHRIICSEVLDFLMTKNSRHVLQKLYLISVADLLYLQTTHNSTLFGEIGNPIVSVWRHAVIIIVGVFWAEEFAKLQKQDAVCAKA